ncbi:type II secretion system protein J [Spongisporangium articulatum]|uniref:Type II secretion system protein J n=1 Tax=Spongisporangium articulatum TaxID=3362603 RepID=A0ABW8ATF1_9ACTN
MFRAIRRRRAVDDRGMTLVELMVAMSITSVLAIAVTALFLGLMRSTSFLNGTMDSTAEARVAAEAISRVLRVAAPDGATAAITVAKSDTITFTASLDRSNYTSTTPITALTTVTFAYSNGCLNRTQTVSGVTQTACVMRTTTAPVFSYYTSGSSTTPLTVPAYGLDDATRRSVKSIEVTLTGSKTNSSGRSAIATVSDRVVLTNCQLASC